MRVCTLISRTPGSVTFISPVVHAVSVVHAAPHTADFLGHFLPIAKLVLRSQFKKDKIAGEVRGRVKHFQSVNLESLKHCEHQMKTNQSLL